MSIIHLCIYCDIFQYYLRVYCCLHKDSPWNTVACSTDNNLINVKLVTPVECIKKSL